MIFVWKLHVYLLSVQFTVNLQDFQGFSVGIFCDIWMIFSTFCWGHLIGHNNMTSSTNKSFI